MQRRKFLQLSATAPAAMASVVSDTPQYRIVTNSKSEPHKGFPASVVSVHSAKSIDEATEKADPQTVHAMIERGMTSLTGEKTSAAAWKTFFNPADVVGIKVNCSGAPGIMSHPVVVADIVRNLVAVGVKPEAIYIYERFPDQLESVNYGKYLDRESDTSRLWRSRGSDSQLRSRHLRRSELLRRRGYALEPGAAGLRAIHQDHQRPEHEGPRRRRCHRVPEEHRLRKLQQRRPLASQREDQHVIVHRDAGQGEPLRSNTVLQHHGRLRGVWHGGPFQPHRKFRFFPKKMMFGTDPVAMDRLLIDIIDDKRKAEHARSVRDRSGDQLITKRSADPNKNQFIREPGHIEYAGSLHLGEYNIAKIKLKEFEL